MTQMTQMPLKKSSSFPSIMSSTEPSMAFHVSWTGPLRNYQLQACETGCIIIKILYAAAQASGCQAASLPRCEDGSLPEELTTALQLCKAPRQAFSPV